MSPAGPGLNPPPQGISPDTRSWLPPTPAGQCAQQLMNLASQLMSTRDQRPAMGWQYIKINIVDDEEYEKTECFYIELDEPYIIKVGTGATSTNVQPKKTPSQEVRLAEMGKPQLGDTIRITIHIKESQEFKSVVDKMLKKANLSLVVGTSSWREQFVDAITVSAGQSCQEQGVILID
ncbi:hypothetical protein ACOMHN_058256 [Nucella lapillus]